MRLEEGFIVKLVGLAVSFCFAAATALAQTPAPMPPAIEAPQDIAFPGEIKLSVDARDVGRGIFYVHETIPVPKTGEVTLLYPNWLPGNHAPRGSLEKVAGLVVTAKGKRLEWTRDTVDMAAFHVSVPEGVDALEVEFQFLSARDKGEGRIVATPNMLNLQWNSVALYPAGYYVSRIPIEASVVLPDGWQYGVALRPSSTKGNRTTFKPVSFETLVDSPMFAGRYFRQFALDTNSDRPIVLDAVADGPDLLDASEETLDIHRKLVQQADKLFGSRHYDHYDFLVAATDELGGIGLEHHRSSENAVPPTYFTKWSDEHGRRDLLAHEYTHSWNGKFRRPADLWTPNYDVPMRDSLLWVYEGQTQYWGYVLSARSGLMSKEDTLGVLAFVAATYDANRQGRAWRALQDTTNDPIIASRRPLSWRSWQRSEDYYSEGQLIWLDVDTLIREKTGGKKSLDDFAKAFFGIDDGSYKSVTYTFDDVVKTLNAVTPYDWAGFLRSRLDGHGPGAPIDGFERGGYKLVYTDTPTEFYKANEKRRKILDLTFSLGVIVGKDGEVNEVRWDGPAFKAGLTTASKIVAVNGLAYTPDRLKDGVAAAADKKAKPVELLIKAGERYTLVPVDYKGGLRYPRLEKIAGAPASLDDILAAR